MSSVPSGLDAWLAHNERISSGSAPQNPMPEAGGQRITRAATHTLDTWHHAADVAEQLVTDIANKANDKADTELDSTRVHDGMTLDEFLAKK